jgi:hypothetical protein
MNLLDTAGDKGFSNFDVINNFTLNYTVELPGQSLAGVGGKVLGGWQLGGIVTLASGVPQNIELGYDVCRCLNGEFLGVFGTDTRPDLASGGDNNPVLGDGREPLKYFDSSDSNFVVGPSGFHGDLGRNTLRIPGVAQWDFSLIKNTSLGEEAEVQFRAEFFNIFNRANFGSPSTSLFFGPGRPNAGAGRITSLTTTSREIQLGLKIIF